MPASDYKRAPAFRVVPPDRHRPKFAEWPLRAFALAAAPLLGAGTG